MGTGEPASTGLGDPFGGSDAVVALDPDLAEFFLNTNDPFA